MPLQEVLDLVQPKPEAALSSSAASTATPRITRTEDPGTSAEDASGSPVFYGSIDMADATHPQTILAYDMNGQALPVEHGAPLRVRVERQLGYKMTKYIKSIELVKSFDDIGEGKGGYWKTRATNGTAGSERASSRLHDDAHSFPRLRDKEARRSRVG